MCKLNKFIYGFKQTSRQWYSEFDEIIISYSFKENIVNQCIYLRVSESKYISFILYVDNILFVANDIKVLFEKKTHIVISF